MKYSLATKIVTIASMMSFSNTLMASELNLSNELNSKVRQTFPQLPIPGTPGFCAADGTFPGLDPLVSGLARCELAFRNVRSTNIDVVYSSVKAAPIPNSVVKEVYSYKNCGDKVLQINDTLSLTTMEGNTIQRSTTIIEGSSVQLTNNITIPIKAVVFQMTDTRQLSFSNQTSDSETINLSTSRQHNQQISINVEPKTVYYVTLQKSISNGYIDVQGNVEIDADVVIRSISRGNGSLQNELSAGSLSTLLPSMNQRIIQLQGQVWNATGTTVERIDKVERLSDESVCAPQIVDFKTNREWSSAILDNNVVQLRNLLSQQPQTLTTDNAFNLKSLVSQLTTIPVVSGTMITTANVIASANIRAKSFGPGLCAVTINGGNGTASFLAPTLIWSPWTNLFSHIGRLTTTISTRVGCDTGALFELQYYR